MRFTIVSSIAVAMLASDAIAWSTQRSYSNRHGGWRWNWPSSSDAVAEPVTTAVAGGVVTELVTEIVAPTVHTTVQTSVKKTSTAAAAPVATGGSSSALDSDQQACLDAHNKARSDVGTNALVWDDDLAAGAQEWANNLASTGSFEHSGADGVGENLYMQSNSDSPFLNAANAWISEKSSYNGEVIDSSNYMNFGHYTQIVWKSTTKVGVAVAKGSSGSYVVARYSPPGNYIGEKPY